MFRPKPVKITYINPKNRIKQMNIWINGNIKSLNSDDMTIAGLIVALNLTGKRLAIEKNGEIVPRSQFGDVAVQDGDKLEIVGAVGGG
jgi:sulfur carrier protein